MHQVVAQRHPANGGKTCDQAGQRAGLDDQHDHRNVAECHQDAADVVWQQADSEHVETVPLVLG